MDISEQIKQIKDFSYAKMSADTTGHNFDHIERVVNMVQNLSESEHANQLITLAAAYLHDVADDKLVDDPANLEKEIKEFLQKIDFTDEQANEVLFITHNIGFSKSLSENPPKLTLEGQIVQDADRLDAIGAIGITRAIYYGGANAETIYDPAVKPRENMDKKEYRNLSDETIINHFYEKLLKLEGMMNTKSAQAIAKKRHKFMEDYLAEFKEEWNFGQK